MAGLAEQYVKGIHKELAYWATWAPGVKLALGDCGPVENGIFRREANVSDWGISFEAQANPVTGGWSFISDKSAEITLQAAGGAQNIPEVPQGKAGLSITFADDEAVCLAAFAGNEGSIANIHRLKHQLLQKGGEDGADAFPRDFAVVTNLVTADATTVLVAQQKGGRYVASAEADLQAGLVDLANLSLGVSLAHSSRVRTELDAKEGATPLFRGVRLKRKWWFWLQTSSLSEDTAPEELPFDEDPFGQD